MINNSGLVKKRVQKVTVAVSIILLVSKLAAYYITNSVGILTDALESIVNVIAGIITLLGIYIAIKPRDTKHPFGHGKVELITASSEGLMIIGAGVLIIIEAINRLYNPTVLNKLDVGIYIVALSGVINYITGWYSIHNGKKFNSIALIAGGKHLQSDTYSSIGLVIGLILLYITKLQWIDSALAILFGLIIIFTGVKIIRSTILNLIDTSNDEDTQKLIVLLNSSHTNVDWVDVHNSKIIRYGSNYSLECDLTLPWYYSIQQGHDSYVHFRDMVREIFTEDTIVSVHFDPCKPDLCRECRMSECSYRKFMFVSPKNYTIEVISKNDEDQNML